MGRKRSYPTAFRQQMVALVRSGRSANSLAKEFEPAAQTISAWVRQADRDEGRRDDGLKEVKRRVEKQLEASNHSGELLDDLHEDDLWGLDLSRETADDAASMKEVLRITSKFKGSIAKVVSEERDER